MSKYTVKDLMVNDFTPKSFKPIPNFKTLFKYVYHPNDDSYLFLFTLFCELDDICKEDIIDTKVVVEIG